MPVAASTKTSAAQPDASTQPGSTQSLKMLLTKQCAKIGEFKVIVFKPYEDTYAYQWEGQKRETTAWRCVLVSAEDSTQYCHGEFKLTTKNKDAYEKNKQMHKEGTTLIMSKVALVDSAKAQYMSCSVRVSINMATTKLTGVFGSPSAVQPVPKTTVVQTKELRQNQHFDLTAFMLSRTAVRNGGDGKKAIDFELADGSTDESTGKVQTISVAIFMNDAEVDKHLQFLDKSKDQKDPISFFNLTGGKAADQEAYRFSVARKGFSMIVADSNRATSMREKAPELYNLADKTAVPQTQWIPNDSFASQSATVTTMKFLGEMGTSLHTGIEDIDAQTTLWQLNWAQILEPPLGTTLVTKDGQRLWFPVVVRDFQGSMTMYINEAAALKCSKQADSASFQEAHATGRLAFPIVASVKILRKKENNGKFELYVVDCDEQDYASAPTAKALEMLKLPLHCRQTTGSESRSVEQPADIFLAASLGDIQTSAFYPLTVRYAKQTVPDMLVSLNAAALMASTITCNCTSVLALVASTQASQKTAINEKGTTVTTQGVKDILLNDGCEYTLTAHCTTDSHMDFMLTPPKRTSQQAALVVICGILDDDESIASAERPARNFLVESVLPLHETDAQTAKASLLKLMSLIALAKQASGLKRENSDWSAEANPAKIAKCRILARYPTGDDIPTYDGHK